MRFSLRALIIVLTLGGTELVAEDETDPYLLADSGRHYLLRGDWDRAFELLKKADSIASNGMSIPDFVFRAHARLSDVHLSFGINQVRNMLADRPNMAQCVR